MDNNLQDAIKSAAGALANMADEAGKLSQELSELKARVERHEEFNQSLKQLFDTYYGGNI